MNWLRNILGLKGKSHHESPGWQGVPFSKNEIWDGYGLDRAVSWFAEGHAKSTPFDQLYASWRWFEIRRMHVDKWADLEPEVGRRCLCVATMNSSGYVREAAVRALAAHPHPESLPFVLWALRDWVEQVRAASLDSLRAYMKPELAVAFVEQYELIDRLRRLCRADLSNIVDEIRSFLASEKSVPSLVAVLQGNDAPLRAFVFRLREADLVRDQELQELAASDSDPSIRGWFVSQSNRFEQALSQSWQARLIRDKSALVVRRVIWSLDQEARDLLCDELIEAACGPSRAVREAARHAAPGMTQEEFALVYRNRLDLQGGSEPTPGLVGGLGETGTQVDVERLTMYANSLRSRVRFEAIRGLVRVVREVASEVLLDHLADTSGRIRHLVAGSLFRDMSDHELMYLHEVLSKDNNVLASMTAMRALTMSGSWHAIPAILLGAASSQESLRDDAWRRGWTWMRKYAAMGWIQPSLKIRPHLEMALARFRSRNYLPAKKYEVRWHELLTWTESVLG